MSKKFVYVKTWLLNEINAPGATRDLINKLQQESKGRVRLAKVTNETQGVYTLNKSFETTLTEEMAKIAPDVRPMALLHEV